MKITDHLAQHLLDVYTGGNWTEVNVAATLSGIKHQEAIVVTDASPNSIAALVHHLRFWNWVMIQRVQGIKPDIPDANGFDVGILSDETSWQLLIRELMVSAAELAVVIKDVDESRLEAVILPGYPSVYKSLQGMVEHVHYHLGQIVVIKQLIRFYRS